MVARMPDDAAHDISYVKTFPGRKAFIPSNPVREKSVPGYAASERRSGDGYDPKPPRRPPGSGGLGSLCQAGKRCQRGAVARGCGPHAVVLEAGYQMGTRPQLTCGPPR